MHVHFPSGGGAISPKKLANETPFSQFPFVTPFVRVPARLKANKSKPVGLPGPQSVEIDAILKASLSSRPIMEKCSAIVLPPPPGLCAPREYII